MTAYAFVLPLLTAIFGLSVTGYTFLIKNKNAKKFILLLLYTFLMATYALMTALGMLGKEIFWQASFVFLSAALFSVMFFTIQLTREVKETDSVLFLLFLIATTAGILSIEKMDLMMGIYLPTFSTLLYCIFIAFVVVVWCMVSYNLWILALATRKRDLRKHRKKLSYLFLGINLSFALLAMDSLFACTHSLMIPLLPIFAPIPLAFIFFFVFAA